MAETILLNGLYYKRFTITSNSDRVSVSFPGTGDLYKSYSLHNCTVSQGGRSVNLTFSGSSGVAVGSSSITSDYASIILNANEIATVAMIIIGWFPIEFLENIGSSIYITDPIILGPGATYGGPDPEPDSSNNPIEVYPVTISEELDYTEGTTDLTSGNLPNYWTVFRVLTTDPYGANTHYETGIYTQDSDGLNIVNPTSSGGDGGNRVLSSGIFDEWLVYLGDTAYLSSWYSYFKRLFQFQAPFTFEISIDPPPATITAGRGFIIYHDIEEFVYGSTEYSLSVTYNSGTGNYSISFSAPDDTFTSYSHAAPIGAVRFRYVITETTATYYIDPGTGSFIEYGTHTLNNPNELSDFILVPNNEVTVNYIIVDPVESIVLSPSSYTNAVGGLELSSISVHGTGTMFYGLNQGHNILPFITVGGYQSDNDRVDESLPMLILDATARQQYCDMSLPALSGNAGDDINWGDMSLPFLSADATITYAYGYFFLGLEAESKSFIQGIPGSISTVLKPSILLFGHEDIIEIADNLFWGM